MRDGAMVVFVLDAMGVLGLGVTAPSFAFVLHYLPLTGRSTS
jgi:hypothetical protein